MRNRLVPKMNDLDLCLRSYRGHVSHCVTFDVEYLRNRYRWRLVAKGPRIGNGLRGIKWSCDRRRHVTMKGQTRDPNMLTVLHLENG